MLDIDTDGKTSFAAMVVEKQIFTDTGKIPKRSNMQANELITDIAERINIEYDGGESFSFEADGLAFTIVGLSEIDSIALTGDIGETPPEKLEGLYKTLLGANYLFGGTGGAAISLNPETCRITLCRALPLVALDCEKFYHEVEQFVNTAQAWSKIVADYRSAAGETPDGENFAMPGIGGFMQV